MNGLSPVSGHLLGGGFIPFSFFHPYMETWFHLTIAFVRLKPLAVITNSHIPASEVSAACCMSVSPVHSKSNFLRHHLGTLWSSLCGRVSCVSLFFSWKQGRAWTGMESIGCSNWSCNCNISSFSVCTTQIYTTIIRYRNTTQRSMLAYQFLHFSSPCTVP